MAFRYERLQVWPKALDFADRAVSESLRWPETMQSSFGDQVRRAAVSIVANITEGSGKRTARSRRAFYDHAKGSTYEVIGIMALVRKRGFMDNATYAAFYRDGDEVAAMLWGLMEAEMKNQRREERKEKS